jgi:hypothetical protein
MTKIRAFLLKIKKPTNPKLNHIIKNIFINQYYLLHYSKGSLHQ